MAVVPARTRPSSVPERRSLHGVRLLGAAALLVTAQAHALQVTRVETGMDQGVYRVRLEAVLDAPADSVARVLTDFVAYQSLDPRIRSSEVSPGRRAGEVLLATRVRACAAFFCRTIDRVERVTRTGNRLVAEVVPDRSDFRRGTTRTTWTPAQGRTRISYSAEFEPDFWVPALVGRRYAVGELRDSTMQLFTNVETRAREQRR